MNKYIKNEYYKIIQDIISIDEFKKLKNITHHGITRYDHSLRVSYYTYLITKNLHLDYKKATRAALLHDFYFDEVEEFNEIFKLRRHPNFALENAKKYFTLSNMEEDIIKSHMFPVTFTPPKYLESWIVDIIDDFSAVYERSSVTKKELKAAMTFIFLIFVHYIKIKFTISF